MTTQRPILIAGGGPVGVITALALARQGLPVHVFEAEAKVNDMPRAATTHAATLEMLAGPWHGRRGHRARPGRAAVPHLGPPEPSRSIAEFDFGMLKDETPYPFAVQCEQHKLAGMAIERLKKFPARQGRVLRAGDVAHSVRRRRRDRGRDRRRHAQGRGLLPDRLPKAAARPCARRSTSSSRATPIPNAS